MSVKSTWPRAMAGANTCLTTPSWKPSGAGLKAIIALHGRGGTSLVAGFGNVMLEPHPWRIAQSGFAVFGVDMGNTWWDGATTDGVGVSTMGDIKGAYNELLNVIGMAGTKVGLLGISMGGGCALQFIKQAASLVSCAYLINPCTDLDFFHQTAGYTPSYSTSGNTYAGAFVAEIDTDYGGNYAVNAVGHKIRDEYSTWHGLGIPITIAQASDDLTVPPAASAAFVTGVNDANVTQRGGSLTGGHGGAAATIPFKELVDFFQAHA